MKELQKNRIKYVKYEEAKKILKDNGITTSQAYRIFVKNHPELNLPLVPYHYYRSKGWNGTSNFLNKPKMNFPTLEEAILILKEHKIDSVEKYIEFRKEMPQFNLFSNPNTSYKGKGWKSWCHYLSIGKNRFSKKFISYEEFKKIVDDNKFKTAEEYIQFRKNNPDLKLPYYPTSTYPGEKNIPKIFPKRTKYKKAKKNSSLLKNGSPRIKSNSENSKSAHIVPYEVAQRIVRENNITLQKDYYKFVRTHHELNLPSTPRRFYMGKGWDCWTSFLGLGEKKKFLSYEEAKATVREHKIKTMEEYSEFRKNNPDVNLHSHPERFYKGKGWRTWRIFLGQIK